MAELEEEIKTMKYLGKTMNGIFETQNSIDCKWALTWSDKCTCFFISYDEAQELRRSLENCIGNSKRTERQYLWLGVIIGSVLSIVLMDILRVCFKVSDLPY